MKSTCGMCNNIVSAKGKICSQECLESYQLGLKNKEKKQCYCCGLSKPTTEFPTKNGQTLPSCKLCDKKLSGAKTEQEKKFMMFNKGGKCEQCGYANKAALNICFPSGKATYDYVEKEHLGRYRLLCLNCRAANDDEIEAIMREGHSNVDLIGQHVCKECDKPMLTNTLYCSGECYQRHRKKKS